MHIMCVIQNDMGGGIRQVFKYRLQSLIKNLVFKFSDFF